MTLAALLSAGAPLEEVSRELEKLGVPFALRAEPAEVSGIRALHLSVEHPEQQRGPLLLFGCWRMPKASCMVSPRSKLPSTRSGR